MLSMPVYLQYQVLLQYADQARIIRDGIELNPGIIAAFEEASHVQKQYSEQFESIIKARELIAPSVETMKRNTNEKK